MSLLKSISKFADTVFPGTGQFLNPDSYSGKKQQEDANRMAMLAWNLSNDYNSPKSQVERLVSAGLNPYLVNISGNTAGVPGISGGGIATEAESSFRGLNNIIGVMQGQANLQNTRAQTQASTAAAGASTAMTHLNETKAENQSIVNQLTKDTMIADLDYKRQQTQLAKAQTAKTRAEADISQGEASLLAPVGGTKGASTLAGGLVNMAKTGIRAIRTLKR